MTVFKALFTPPRLVATIVLLSLASCQDPPEMGGNLWELLRRAQAKIYEAERRRDFVSLADIIEAKRRELSTDTPPVVPTSPPTETGSGRSAGHLLNGLHAIHGMSMGNGIR